MTKLAQISIKKVKATLISNYSEISQIVKESGSIYILPIKSIFTIQELLNETSNQQILKLISDKHLYRVRPNS